MAIFCDPKVRMQNLEWRMVSFGISFTKISALSKKIFWILFCGSFINENGIIIMHNSTYLERIFFMNASAKSATFLRGSTPEDLGYGEPMCFFIYIGEIYSCFFESFAVTVFMKCDKEKEINFFMIQGQSCNDWLS